MIDAGRLRHRIEIQDYPGEQQDTHGDDVRDYFAFATDVPAEIVDKGGRALFIAQQTFAEANALITIRHLAGITDKMRVYYAAEEKYYDILNVGHDGDSRRSDMQLICRTGLIDQRADVADETTR